MTFLTISTQGRIVIPAKLRCKYGLRPGSQIQIVDYGGVLALIPTLDNPIEQATGILKGSSSLTKVLLAEHAQEIAGE